MQLFVFFLSSEGFQLALGLLFPHLITLGHFRTTPPLLMSVVFGLVPIVRHKVFQGPICFVELLIQC